MYLDSKHYKKMKNNRIIYLFNVFSLLFISCNLNDDNSQMDLIVPWNLINVSGGFAGIDDDYEPNIIVWKFNDQTTTLTVENNNLQNNIYDGLATGIYNYTIIESNNRFYIDIEGTEFGEYNITGTNLIIDGNSFSHGNGADGFILTFER